jgi:hypothetical protein
MDLNATDPQTQTAAPEQEPIPHGTLSAFIAFHIIAIFFWSMPLNTLLVGVVRDAVGPYFLWSGLWQGWDMFAPNPYSTNAYLEAEVVFRDGQQRVWKFPRMQDLGLVDRYFKERYRKWANERVRMDANSVLWPDAARYIARLHANPRNPPQTVRLVRYWAEVPPPGPGVSKPAYQRYVFYTYTVAPGDLL